MKNIFMAYVIFISMAIIYYVDKTSSTLTKVLQENKELQENIIKYDFDSTNKLEMDIKTK